MLSDQRQADREATPLAFLVNAAVTTPPAAADISIVVPTRNESENIVPLVDRLDCVTPAPREIIFVDDSDDNTPDTIGALAASQPEHVRLLHRRPGHRSGGLGGAVVAGIQCARFPWVVVMDGDLQHPPETVPALIDAALATHADAVVASRYRGDGSAHGLAGRFRRVVSGLSGRLARLAFPRRLSQVTDAMSGFFVVRREVLDDVDLRPHGYKILLEILVRGRIERIAEVPYTFAPRSAGESKASLREGLRFLRHLVGLRCVTLIRPRSQPARMVGFAVAGASGVVVNTAVLWLLGGMLGMPYLLASLLSIQTAIAWNFIVVDRLVMPSSKRRVDRRLARFWLLNNSLVPLHLGLLYGLVEGVRMHYLTANVLAITAVFVIRYVITSRWVYGPVDQVLPATVLRAATRTWRAAHTRIALAFLLTLVAVPAIATMGWNGLWTSGPDAPLLIPLAAAAALLVGRLRPKATEPDVHDRQVDVLIAAMLLGVAVVLTAMTPDSGPTASALLLAAGVAYLAAATTLLLGTRTAARLRWVLPLPMVAAAAVTPDLLDRLGARVVRDGAALLGAPFGARLDDGSLTVRHSGDVLVLADSAVPGIALAATLMCLCLAGLCCFGPSPALLLRVAPAAAVVTVVAILSVAAATLVGRLFGADAFRLAQVPAVVDMALAASVTVLVWRWSRSVQAPQPIRRHHVPRAQVAVVALVLVAAMLGVRTLPDLTVLAPRPGAAAQLITDIFAELAAGGRR
jgi:putative flippase GtrA